ncbi:hypothetical protein RDABS01_033951, partial [Bienertia sinuspersici]
MLSEPSSLWSRVLHGKYCKGRCIIDMLQPKENSSNLWRGIVDNVEYIHKGTQIAIGNGQSTLFWDHHWVVNQPLIDLGVKEVPPEIMGATVKSYLTLTQHNQSEAWVLLFSISVWWIWKWRNQAIFRGENTPVNKEDFLWFKLEEVTNALKRDLIFDIWNVRKQEAYIQWSPPIYRWVVLNTDGAAKGCPGQAGGGGIFRNHMGQRLGYFSTTFGLCTAMKAELLALLKGLQMAWNMEVRFLDVRMDNAACTQIFNKQTGHFGANLHIVKQCQQIISNSRWTVVISHCYREANRAADWLANRGIHHQEYSCEPSHLPVELAKIINEDSME